MNTAETVNSKEEELTARQVADRKTAIGRYDQLVAVVEEARITTADKYWLKGYAERTEEKNEAFKDVQIVAKQKAQNINHKVDLDDLTKAVAAVKKACDRLDEYRANMVRDVEALCDFVTDWPLFKKEMPKSATYDFATGQVLMTKNA